VPAVPDVRPRFVVEPPLIKLGRWMRAAGDDVVTAEAGRCAIDLAQRAARENRVVLTRRRDFPPGPARALLILADRLEDQLAQVYTTLGAPDVQGSALTRCVLCNTALEEVDRRSVALPPRVEIREPRVMRCPSCARLFWEGTHTEAMRSRLQLVLDRVREAGSSIPASPRAAAPELNPGTTEENRRIAELRSFLESFGFAWRGYRKKRRKARANLARRMGELGLPNLAAYAMRVRADGAERRRLHAVVGITVSRFFRDRVDWDLLGQQALAPWAARGGARRAWSIGCASGEEPFTLRLLWLAFAADAALEILATEVQPELIERARRGIYPRAALHSMPSGIAERWMRQAGATVALDPALVASVDVRCHDYLLDPWPVGFDLILARNGIFTYRAREEHEAWLERVVTSLRPEGWLFLGSNDLLPEGIRRRFERVGRTLWRLR
jgi:chemotaxis protein methyltransferase CheR